MVVANATAVDGHQDVVAKVKLVDRAKYVEMGAKYFKLLQEAGGDSILSRTDWERMIEVLNSSRAKPKSD